MSGLMGFDFILSRGYGSEEPCGPHTVDHLQQGEVREWRAGVGCQDGALIQSQQCPRHPSSPPPGPGSQTPSCPLIRKGAPSCYLLLKGLSDQRGAHSFRGGLPLPGRAAVDGRSSLRDPGSWQLSARCQETFTSRMASPRTGCVSKPKRPSWVPSHTARSTCCTVEAEGQGHVSGVDLESTA